MKRVVLIGSIICAALFTSGCVYDIANLLQQTEAYEETYDAGSIILVEPLGGAAYFGMSLNLAMRNPQTLNPLINQDVSVDRMLRLVFEPLVEIRENMRPAPNLASRIVFANDGMSAVVTIRGDAFWSDGMKVTSNDVAFSVSVINGPSGSYIYRGIISDIAGIDIIDGDNFRVRFTRPQGGMSFALAFPVIPRHYFEGHINFSSPRNMAPVGNGVFKVESVETVSRVILVPNENSMIRNRPHIQRAYAFITDSSETDFMAFEQGIINVISTDIMAFGRFSGTRNVTITNYDTNDLVFLGFNFNRPLMADKNIREVVAHALNRDHIVNNIYLGIGRASASVINPASHFYRPNLSVHDFDMEMARNMLFRIGARDHENEGVFSKEVAGQFRRLEFSILVNEESPERVAIARILRDNLEELGMRIHLEIHDFETYLDRLAAGNFDMFLGTYKFCAMPDFMPLFHSSSIGTSYNYFAFGSENIDGILEQIAYARNEEQLWHALSDLQEAIAYELPIISIKFAQSTLVTDVRIGGDKRPVMNNIFNNVEMWRLD